MSFKLIPASYTSDGRSRLATNCLWLDTVYWSFPNFDKRNIGDTILSLPVKVRLLDCVFYFKLRKTSNTSVEFMVHRVLKDPKESPGDGFVLHFITSLIGVDQNLADACMSYFHNYVTVDFHFNASNMKFLRVWTVKCFFEMVEIKSEINAAFREQNELLETLKNKRDVKKQKILYGLLYNIKFYYLFSGRQSLDFAKTKLDLIERSFEFVEDLDAVLKKKGILKVNTKLRNKIGSALNFIYKMSTEYIEIDDLLSLFRLTYHYSIGYLKEACEELISYYLTTIDDTDDLKSFVCILIVSDLICGDSLLIDDIAMKFNKCRSALHKNDMWSKCFFRQYPPLYSINYSLQHRVQQKQQEKVTLKVVFETEPQQDEPQQDEPQQPEPQQTAKPKRRKKRNWKKTK